MIILDTHVLVWLAGDAERLSRPATAAVRKALASGGLAIASITLWELAMLFTRGRLRGQGTIESSIRSIVDATGVTAREITPEIAALATQFPHDFRPIRRTASSRRPRGRKALPWLPATSGFRRARW